MTIKPRDIVFGDLIATQLPHAGIALSLANLLELMLVHSDNTATDEVLKAVGGPAAVTDWLRSVGIEHQRIDRTVVELVRDYFRLPPGPVQAALAAHLRKHPEDFGKPNPDFEGDIRDSTSPAAMVRLLGLLSTGEGLSAESSGFLLAIMKRCRTGPGRLKGLLPPGTVLSHKTGSIGGVTNDVGVVALPRQLGRLLIAVFIKGSSQPEAAREHVIAQIARAAYDHFVQPEP